MNKRIPLVGDVIKSPEFAFGSWINTEYQGKRTVCICADGVTTSYLIEVPRTEEEIIAYVKKFNHLPSAPSIIELGAHDTKRGQAEYVVEQVTCEPSDDEIIHREDPCVTVFARKLNSDSSYNEAGELIYFRYNYDGLRGTIKNITFVRQMKRLFI